MRPRPRAKPSPEGVGQVEDYAGKLAVRFAFATNGRGIYAIDMVTGKEWNLSAFPSPEELWKMTFPSTGSAAERAAADLAEAWRDRFAEVPFEDKGGSHPGRYYQVIAIERVIDAIAEERQRILLTLATGTGKTFIAFLWGGFHSGLPENILLKKPLIAEPRHLIKLRYFGSCARLLRSRMTRSEPSPLRQIL